MERKGQSSLEYLTIFGIGLTIIIVLTGIFYIYSGTAKQKLDQKQIESIGQELTSTIEKLYFLGEGNRVTLKTNFPEGVDNLTIHHLNNSNATDVIEFDYFNFSYQFEGQYISSIFEARDTYIRFNCTRCNHDLVRNVSYYNQSDFSGGIKNIRIESKGDWVSVDFINDLP
jgi:hypothetical protein